MPRQDLPSRLGVRMRKSRSVLILFVLLSFCVSFGVPAEDVPETPYDESQALPYEKTLQFSIVAPQASAQIAKTELNFGSLTKRCRRRPESNAQSHRVPDSLTIINHSFRC
jgi:hypothetical protein